MNTRREFPIAPRPDGKDGRKDSEGVGAEEGVVAVRSCGKADDGSGACTDRKTGEVERAR